MVRKIFFLILFFYLLTLFQTSFFPHFWPVLIIVVLINLFEPQKEKLGLFSAFFGGFFLDIFSENFIGFWILILLTLAFFIKLVLRKHVQFPIFKR
jgi:rod shape-determining protein MreD